METQGWPGRILTPKRPTASTVTGYGWQPLTWRGPDAARQRNRATGTPAR